VQWFKGPSRRKFRPLSTKTEFKCWTITVKQGHDCSRPYLFQSHKPLSPKQLQLRPSDSIQNLHVAFPNFVLAFISKSSVLAVAVAVASTQGPALYAAVSSVCISCGHILYHLFYHEGELLKCFYRVHVIRIIEVQLLFITSQFKPWICWHLFLKCYGHFDPWNIIELGIHYLICVHAYIFSCLLHSSIFSVSWILQNLRG
jgi:hypothetical protein